MNYTHCKEESAEYLRLALPLMSRQDAALHPISYAVWYEYVAGINHALNATTDALLAKGAPLDEDEVKSLFERHVADIGSEGANRIAESFQQILGKVAESTCETVEEATLFSETLKHLTRDSAHPDTPIDLNILLKAAQVMQTSVATLNTRLNAGLQEIMQLRSELNRARDVSLTDGLTGLTNRRGFDQILVDCLSDASTQDADSGPCLLMGDIDHFKNINDTYGHVFGDKVIRAVAGVIKQNVKGRDTAARYGGEEFVILLPDTPLSGAQALAENIRSAIERGRIKRVGRAGSEVATASVTLSLGIAHYIQGESDSDFIDRADRALYMSKQGGRNRVSVATSPGAVVLNAE
jgi:diguanylate cyclase